MKCLLVVNQLNDPLYIDHDTEFSEYIILRAKEKGLLENEAIVTKLDANLVMQIFSPLVLSQWLLIDQTKEPCSTILCPAGYLFVFKQLDDLLFLTINGDGSESETFLKRKLEVFVTMMRFLFGPVNEESSQSHSYSKNAKWDFLREVMKNWLDMAESEQSFLVEAIERLHVNQMVSEKCIEVLERTVKQFQASREQTINHAILLVNSKLLALYSNRGAHELRSKDILSLTVLSRTIFPYTDALEDLFSVHYMEPKMKQIFEEDNSDGAEDEYHSAPNTPGGQRSISPSVTLHRETISSHYTSASFDHSETFYTSNVSDGLKDTLSSVSGSGTIRNSDIETSENDITLLDMYAEKYPNATFKPDVHAIKTHAEIHQHQEHRSLEQISKGSSSNLNTTLVGELETERLYDDKPLPGSTADQSSMKSLPVNHITSAHDSSIVEDMGSPMTETSALSTSDHDVVSLNGCEDGKIDTFLKQSPTPSSQSSSAGVGGKWSRSSTLSLEPNIEAFTPSRSSSVISNMSKSYPELSSNDGQECVFTALEVNQTEDVTDFPASKNRKITPSKLGKMSALQTSSPRFATVTLEESISTRANIKSYWPYTVFLETSYCPYSPYNIHFLQVLPGVTVLLLSQVQKHSMAESIYQIISSIQDLIHNKQIKNPRSRSNQVYEVINSLLSKLHSGLKKNKGAVAYLIADIHGRWEKDDLKNKLTKYLEKDQRFPIPTELESQLMELYKKLKELFSYLFLSPVQYSSQLLDMLTLVRTNVSKDLLDYRDYLNVKAQRNITMTSYIDEFPGLIHFIFIDRLFHQMSAPSLNISLSSGDKMDATSFLKKKIWSMYQHVMRKLTEGYTTILLRDGDFYFSYFLWFEDYMGNALPVQESFKPSSKFSYPGILSGSFYKALQLHCFPHAIQNSIHCFEMFLVHLGTVHPEYIAAHCKCLAHKMWEMSGEAYNSVNLL